MHKLKGVSTPASPACYARAWIRDPAVWAWAAVGLLALLPLGSALAQLHIG